MKFKTLRAQLRPLHIADLENMRALESDPDIMKFTPSRVPQTAEQTEARLKSQIGKEGIWAAEFSDNLDFIGWFMLLKRDMEFTELGFMIVQKHWGKGLTTEIAQALIDYAFKDLKLIGLSARTNLKNTASIRVLQKLGFQEVSADSGLKIFRLTC